MHRPIESQNPEDTLFEVLTVEFITLNVHIEILLIGSESGLQY